MISISEKYSGQAEGPSADYPNGTFKNRVGSVRGTPLEQEWARDIDGGRQAVIKDCGIPLNNVADTRIVSQYQKALDSRYTQRTANPVSTIQSICAEKYYGDFNWASPDAFPNKATIGGSVQDSCIGVDYDTELPCVFVIMSSAQIKKVTGLWQYDANLVTSSALSLDFGETPASITSLCCDGIRLYVLWRNATNGYHLSSFNLTDMSRYLNVAFGIDYDSLDQYAKVIVASDDYVAISIDNISGDPGVIVVNKSTGAFTTGTGTGTPGTSAPFQGCGRIVTDGEHLFWLHIENTGGTPYSSYLCSAKISDPTTSDYSQTLIYSSNTIMDVPTGLYNLGDTLLGSIMMMTSSGRVYSFSKAGDVSRACLEIANAEPYGLITTYRTVVGCDGMNFWAVLMQYNRADEQSRLSFVRIPMTLCVRNNAGDTLIDFSDYYAEIVMTTYFNGETSNYEPGRLFFDGRDVVYVDRDGYVARIVNPGAR